MQASNLALDQTTVVPFSADTREARFRTFLHWLDKNGASYPGSRLHVENGTRELRAVKDLRQGEMAIFIPAHLMITGELAWHSEIGRRIRPLDLPIGAVIATFLLACRREEGFFTPYIDILPEDVSHMPMYMSEIELAYLAGTAALAKVREEIDETRTEYRALAGLLPPDMLFDEQDYMWAKGLARSRLLNVRFMTEAAMVPLVDMMNHSLERNIDWGGESKLGFVCTAARPIEEGQVLTLSYGRTRGNGTLFAYYGFTLDDNPNDDTEILLPRLTCGDAPEQEEDAVIRGNQRLFTPVARYEDERTQSLLKHLRRLQGATLPDSGARPVDRANELAALAMLKDACIERLSGFASLGADTIALAGILSPRLHGALRVRDGEMRVLQYLLGLSNAGTAFLRGERHAPGFESYITELGRMV